MVSSQLGKYRIVKWLGGGQFGDVYLGFDTILEKEFALKIARMREKDILMLKDEAKLLSSLDHRNIVRFYNIDMIDKNFIMVMEYVEGKSLRSLMEERIPIPSILSYLEQILRAIEYAHKEGIIHRDLKPENILISKDGTVKVTDFGLAKFLRPGSLSASIAGTPIYMAPEAWKGKFLKESDIYSLGAILYELLTQKAPFLADTLENIRKLIFRSKPTPPSLLNPDIPKELEGVVLSCLEKSPKDRPPASELLKTLFKGKGIEITPFPSISILHKGFSLTPQQEEVIECNAPHILLLGSAGTGKTTTLVYKAYRTIKKGVDPSNVLVMAFTKKAVNDAKERLEHLLGKPSRDIWIDTTHTIGFRILKRDGGRLDIREDFEIRDPSSKGFKLILPGFGEERLRTILSTIEDYKTRLLSPEEADRRARTTWEKVCAEVYKKYQEILKERNLLDFDDLIYYPVKLLEEYEDLREFYSKKFSHIFVDELQDLNYAQYRLIQLLYSKNIFFTGDEDQSIYEWRGARKEFIYQVAKDFPDIRTFILTRNFRLPEKVLKIAENLISHNRGRQQKLTFTTKEGMGNVELYTASNEDDEANFVRKTIKSLINKEKRAFSDIAILYRLNSQSRVFEEVMAHSLIPYSVVGTERFYEREEVRNLTEFLRAIDKKELEILLPIIGWLLNFKKRETSKYLRIKDNRLKLKTTKNLLFPEKIEKCLNAINLILEKKDEFSVYELLSLPLEQSGFLKRLKRKEREAGKLQNITELLESAKKFGPGELSLFLNHLALLENLELVDWGRNTVKLLTVHSAKGLEFPVVFLTGLVEGIFPLIKNTADRRNLEEERRLCFVGATRAIEKLYLSYPKLRYSRPTQVSRFIPEMLGM